MAARVGRRPPGPVRCRNSIRRGERRARSAPGGLTSTVVRGVSLAASGYVLAQALNLGFYIALARLLSPQDFGEFAAATIIVGLSLLVTESGLASAVIQRRTRVDEAASTAAFATIVSGTVFSLLALAAAPLLGSFFDSDRIAALAAASSGTVFLRTIGAVPDALLQRRFSFLRRLVVEPAQVLAFGIAAVIAAASDLGPWALVIGQYAGFAVDATLSWLLARFRPRKELTSFAMWRELVGYGRHVLVATAILHVGYQASNGIVGRFLGTGALGQFRYALRIAGLPFALLLAGAAYVLFPAFARIAEDAARLERAFLRSLRWISVLSFPAGLFFIPLGVPLAVLIFGETWRPAGEALIAMCLFPIGGMVANVVSEALKAIGQPRYLTRMHTMTSVVTVVTMLALQPFGLTAACAGLSIGAVAGGAYAVWLMHRVVGTRIGAMVAEIWPAAVAAACATLILVGVEALVDAEAHGVAVGVLLVIGEALLGTVIYLAAIRALAPQITATLRAGAGTVVRRVARFRGGDPEVAGARAPR